ncbi:MAG: transferase hexapeptide repeat family protein [Calditrichaeota bacterium]|nr:transferase hexapeptide repeat family protein [Calditrichota bacterium]
MAIFEFNGIKPVVSKTAFVHPQATVIGDVIIGEDVYIGPGAVLRGDWGAIRVANGSNIQENCIVHMFPGVTVTFEKNSHIGHGAIIHGATIGENSLIGMAAVLMDNVVIGRECIIGALSFLKEGTQIADRKVVVGNPARIVKDVSDEMIEWKNEGTRLYQTLPELMRDTLKVCEPLREIIKQEPLQKTNYSSWKSTEKELGRRT